MWGNILTHIGMHHTSIATPPPPSPWAGSVQCKLTHQWLDTNASQANQAKQTKHHCPPPHLCTGLQACSASQCINSPTPTRAKQSKHRSPPIFALGGKRAAQAGASVA
jgi:hypothetical protein